MAVVYRVETKTGLGPYVDYNCSKWRTRDHSSSRHPTPWEEGLGRNDNEYCGFRSLQQFKQWFNCQEERQKLAECGFRLVKLKVDKRNIQYGEKQILFIRKAAKLEKVIDLREAA